MDIQFLGVPGVDAWVFGGLAVASFFTTFLGVIAGAAGGLVLLGLMAIVFPPAVLIPVHTVVQLGAGSTRTIIMRRYVMLETLPSFLIGAALGAALGAQIFVALPTAVLQGILGGAIIVLAWLPRIARFGPARGRFAMLGFGVTFIGMFVSATGSFLAPFVASASPDRRNHAATLAALMSVVHVSKIIAFGLLGVAIGAYVPLIAAMIAMGAAGNWVGSRALNRMPERSFRIVLQVVLTVLAARLLWVAAEDAGLI